MFCFQVAVEVSSQAHCHRTFLSRLTAASQTPFLQKNCEGGDKHILKSKVADRKLHVEVHVVFFSAFGVWMGFFPKSSSAFLS